MAIEIRPASAADAEAVTKLAREHPYSEYRWYRRSNFDFAADYSALCAERFLKGDEPLALLAFSGAEAVGFAGVERSAWESDHFGIEMGSVARRHRCEVCVGEWGVSRLFPIRRQPVPTCGQNDFRHADAHAS